MCVCVTVRERERGSLTENILACGLVYVRVCVCVFEREGKSAEMVVGKQLG